jgi:hypothetical protein
MIGMIALGVMTGRIVSAESPESHAVSIRSFQLRGTRATYCRAPRKADTSVDVDALISQLEELHANTYSFCIHGYTNDWEDLKRILPAARAKDIRIWASLVPPSESPPRTKMYPEPFRLDYKKWAEEFAKLSLAEPNLVAWSIDDFTHNLKFYNTNYLKEILSASRAINPGLAFVPCCYYTAITPLFATNYSSLLDGILFPYRHESAGANLTDPSLVSAETLKIKEIMGGNLPVILDLYASPHSKLGATTPEYIATALRLGQDSADGLMIYCHQDPIKDAEKWKIIKAAFSAREHGPRPPPPGRRGRIRKLALETLSACQV